MEEKLILGQQLNQNLGSEIPEGAPTEILPVSITMPKDSLKHLQNFKPFLESSTPDQKLEVFTKTSLFKPKKRIQKLREKRDTLLNKRDKHAASTN